MSFWKSSKSNTSDKDLNDTEMPENNEQQSAESQQHSEDQIDSVIKQLHDEKHKNSELKQNIEELKAVIEEKDKRLKALNEQASVTDNTQQEVPNAPPTKEEQPTPIEQAKSQVDTQPSENEQPQKPDEHQDAIMQQLKNVTELLETRIKELVNDRVDLSNKLEEKNARYQELTDKIQEDRYRKDKVKILRRNINMRNLVSSVLDEYRNESPRTVGFDTPAAIFLEQQLEKIIEKLDADLRQEMLVPLVNGLEGSDFDAEHQEIVERQPTDRPELDGKVYRSVAPGYVWTLPYIFKPRVNENGEEIHTYRFLLRSEDVITYKYVKKEEQQQ